MRRQNPGCILFYRLGDFYEMFFDDAVTVSRELELTLTGKNCGLEERAPMCGVPFHSADTYITRLVQKGYKVAVCEQMEDPKLAKGIVKREVIRIVTPGTNLDATFLDEGKNNYLSCLYFAEGVTGMASCDVSTGDFYVTETEEAGRLADELYRFTPSEIIGNITAEEMASAIEDAINRIGSIYNKPEKWDFGESRSRETIIRHFHVNSLAGLGLDDMTAGVVAAGALLNYITDTLMHDPANITEIHPYKGGIYMVLDSATRRNLELTETMRDKNKRGSLLWVLDKTKTAMGARTLRGYVEKPLTDRKTITDRYDAIEEINTRESDREELREYLSGVYDLERLITRITYNTANPRDILAFRDSIKNLPSIRMMLADSDSPYMCAIMDEIDELKDIYEAIAACIDDDAPMTMHDGDIIKDGYNADVDKYRLAKTDGKQWLSKIEADEREKTGIKNLRIKYNKVFGYYLEVTNSFKEMVPDYYVRKQTLTNAERYITPELKELEDTILGAEDRLNTLEYNLFCELRDKISAEVERIQHTAKAVAALDAILSLAVASSLYNYVRPTLNTEGNIDIKNGRHPVIERMTERELFIPNNTALDDAKNRIAIITGPNMAGKSTYMRQVALIVLMAQMGCFVPAESADICICDRIFTRVGASDDLSSGQSTFMVEMNEVSNILRNATSSSLLILDEIGRGTSTFDGLSIAWSVVEYIAGILCAKTLFATHYHELTELEGQLFGVKNYRIAVREQGENIIFLRKIMPGGADKSYGISVAALAGVPAPVISRAREICEKLIDADTTKGIKKISKGVVAGQMSFFDIQPETSAQTEKSKLEEAV
ncbi:MAG: DNA mismatch repair protein MutS, partial [Lachnospiraceae bacterium]|nr:DNA mismatch repair protein MutS [Lachnospiraceae bacterium]